MYILLYILVAEMIWTVHLEGGPRRVNHAAVCIEDKIYCFGGFCSTEEYRDWDPIPVHVLNTATLRWSTVCYNKSDMIPFQRYGHTAVAYGHKVFILLIILISSVCRMWFHIYIPKHIYIF